MQSQKVSKRVRNFEKKIRNSSLNSNQKFIKKNLYNNINWSDVVILFNKISRKLYSFQMHILYVHTVSTQKYEIMLINLKENVIVLKLH